MAVKTADPAPDFELADQEGAPVRLSSFRGKKSVVLYFYPKDETPVCTAEACAFRDAYEVFEGAGAQVIGVSSDSVESHKKFANKNRISFPLLSDLEGAVRKLYDVSSTLGILPGRVTFVIDQKGIVRHRFSSQFRPQKHIDEALKILNSLG